MSDTEIYEPYVRKSREQIYKSAYVTIALIIINVIVFLVTDFFAGGYKEQLILDPDALLYGANAQWYRLITSTFMHADINHLLNNMLILGALGAIVENYMGHGLYLVMYILSGICGNILTLAYIFFSGDWFRSLGASGCTLGLSGYMLVWIIVNRKLLVEGNMKRNIVVFALITLYACFFQRGANTIAHLGGCLAGAAFGIANIIIFHNSKDMEGIV